MSRAIDALKGALEQIESELVWGDLPVVALEEFKTTLDSVRTDLQAFVGVLSAAEYNTSLRKLRLRRAAQVCESVLPSIVDGTIGPSTPGFNELTETVRETLDRLEQLTTRGA